jgi:hypothetical protein
MKKVPSAPLSNSISAAAASSTAKPRWRFEAIASTATISPMVKRRKSISWIRLIRIGPPPASVRHGAVLK